MFTHVGYEAENDIDSILIFDPPSFLLHSLTYFFSLLDVLSFLIPVPIMILLDRHQFILFFLHPYNKPGAIYLSKTNTQPDLSLKNKKWPWVEKLILYTYGPV